MENALLIGLSRQVALARELDVIANNMANVGTNGFKARSARFNEFLMPVPLPQVSGSSADRGTNSQSLAGFPTLLNICCSRGLKKELHSKLPVKSIQWAAF